MPMANIRSRGGICVWHHKVRVVGRTTARASCENPGMGRHLETQPCRDRCDWQPTDEHDGRRQVFECQGCHSEWTSTQAWTPANADGVVPRAVRKARERNA